MAHPGFTRELVDVASGAMIAMLHQTNVCLGHGGFGGVARPAVAVSLPDRALDEVVDPPTRTDPPCYIGYRPIPNRCITRR